LEHGTVKEQPAESRGVTVEDADGPKFQADIAVPYSHPYYWSGFFLMGNWL